MGKKLFRCFHKTPKWVRIPYILIRIFILFFSFFMLKWVLNFLFPVIKMYKKKFKYLNWKRRMKFDTSIIFHWTTSTAIQLVGGLKKRTYMWYPSNIHKWYMKDEKSHFDWKFPRFFFDCKEFMKKMIKIWMSYCYTKFTDTLWKCSGRIWCWNWNWKNNKSKT